MLSIFRNLIIVIIVLVLPIVAKAQSGFLLGMSTGVLFDSKGYDTSSVLYTANQKTLKSVDPLSVRQVNISGCFMESNFKRNLAGVALSELFSMATEDDKSTKTVLQVVRVIITDRPTCAVIWFTYAR